MLSSFPSPSSDMIPGIGVKYYGVMIAFGVLAAVSVARRRWRAAGHDPDEVADIAVWAVPFGLVGARLYHVITDWEIYRDRPFPRVLEIWNGGLGIPGGIFLGVVGGVLAARYYKIGVAGLADAMAPAIPLAQAIGRLGNYFNQELYGRETDMPWGPAMGRSYRPGAPPQRQRPPARPGRNPEVPGSDQLPAHVPVRSALEPRCVRAAGVDRLEEAPPPGEDAPGVRGGVLHRSPVGRGAP